MFDLKSIIGESIKDALRALISSYLPLHMKLGEDHLHLQKTMEWLANAHENGKGGVSSHFSLLKGKWLDPFPETTGYIIPTFFDYAVISGESNYYDMAVRMADWLTIVQLKNGACMQGTYDANRRNGRPIVFNTGQNIFGFLRAFKETGVQNYLNAAVRAGDFLVSSTNEKKLWDKNLHYNISHTYNSRTCWALLELNKQTKNEKYFQIAMANLEWVISQQNENGWFRQANFKPSELPNTHGIAYTTRGLLESSVLTGERRFFNAAMKTAEKMMRIFEIQGRLYTFWDDKWRNHGRNLKWTRGRYQCLTGNIQFSQIWMRLSQETGDLRYANTAFKMLDHIKTLHNLTSHNAGIRGGIKGSHPVYGSYSFLKYPNWAAKFFADALMLKKLHEKELKARFIWDYE